MKILLDKALAPFTARRVFQDFFIFQDLRLKRSKVCLFVFGGFDYFSCPALFVHFAKIRNFIADHGTACIPFIVFLKNIVSFHLFPAVLLMFLRRPMRLLSKRYALPELRRLYSSLSGYIQGRQNDVIQITTKMNSYGDERLHCRHICGNLY